MRQSKNIKLAKKKADTYFAEFIRARDIRRGCATCAGYGTGDCGHFITRDNGHTRYDEKNCALQCIPCNRFKGGKQFEFSKYINMRWGEGTAEQLLIKSKMPGRPRRQYDYEQIAELYKTKLKEL